VNDRCYRWHVALRRSRKYLEQLFSQIQVTAGIRSGERNRGRPC
jgi:hypothetical protein